MTNKRKTLSVVFLILALTCLAVPAMAEKVTFPLTMDRDFLRAAMLNRVYNHPGHLAEVYRADGGCTLIEIWNPRISTQPGFMKTISEIRVRTGVAFMDNCLSPVEWSGNIELQQQLWVDPDTLKMRVKTVDSRIFDTEMRPTTVGDIVYSLIKSHVHAYLDQFTVDLDEPIGGLKSQLPLFFDPEMRPRVQGWMQTLRPEKTVIDNKAVKIIFALDVDLPKTEESAESAKSQPLTDQERAALVKYWEVWDVFLVSQILSLAEQPLTDEEKDVLLEVLLDKRYGFTEAMDNPDSARDIVREQFVSAWQSLAPIMRKRLWKDPSKSIFKLLAYMTASDALVALDELGPALGLDISEEGLRNLAKLLQDKDLPLPKGYSFDVDNRLRKLLGFGDEQKKNSQPMKPESEPHSDLFDLLPFWPKEAWAQQRKYLSSVTLPMPPNREELAHWLPPVTGARQYFKRILALATIRGRVVMASSTLPKIYKDLYMRILLPATIWQESCWRQFRRVNGEITFVLSYNRSSVGLMQINQRVWRGLYDVDDLRWDIHYNTRAGCEILELYLKRYALGRMRRGEKIPPSVVLQAVYAMYNGGPRQFRLFLRRYQRKRLYTSDKLFYQKYLWVKQGRYSELAGCLPGY